IICVNETIIVNVLANDSVERGIIVPESLLISIPPSNGNVFIDSNYSLSYTPNPGYLGVDSITYKVCTEEPFPACGYELLIISVVDTVAPIIVFIGADKTVSCEDEIIFEDIEAEDSCGDIVEILEQRDTVFGNCDNSYEIIRTFTVIDG